jgi:ABC-2 type transport system ATP-binding protein
MHGSDKDFVVRMTASDPCRRQGGPDGAEVPGAEGAFVEVNDVSKTFGQTEAVSHISFNVAKGAIFGLVGSDGAGKSTILRMAATMLRPSAGNILINGMDVVSQRTKVKALIGYMPQRFGLYQDLTVSENLEFFMDIFRISGPDRKKRRERYLGFSNLLPFIDRLAGDLSGGMKQKLGLACVLVHEPQLLILDEPTNGVDPVSRQEFWEILSQMKGQGMTILVSTAYLDEGEKCDCLGLMHRSRLLDIAVPDQLQSHFSSLEEAMIQRIKQVDEGLLHDRFEF